WQLLAAAMSLDAGDDQVRRVSQRLAQLDPNGASR
ncbi:MAG: hypothetical protein ACI9EF_001741, partial [Pseudohongiellaceae bacterium]